MREISGRYGLLGGLGVVGGGGGGDVALEHLEEQRAQAVVVRAELRAQVIDEAPVRLGLPHFLALAQLGRRAGSEGLD